MINSLNNGSPEQLIEWLNTPVEPHPMAELMLNTLLISLLIMVMVFIYTFCIYCVRKNIKKREKELVMEIQELKIEKLKQEIEQLKKENRKLNEKYKLEKRKTCEHKNKTWVSGVIVNDMGAMIEEIPYGFNKCEECEMRLD